jgi:hypothetical protein
MNYELWKAIAKRYQIKLMTNKKINIMGSKVMFNVHISGYGASNGVLVHKGSILHPKLMEWLKNNDYVFADMDTDDTGLIDQFGKHLAEWGRV